MTRYLVAGTGIAGAESVRVLTRIGHEVVVYDQAESPRLAELEPLAAADAGTTRRPGLWNGSGRGHGSCMGGDDG